MTYVHPTLTIPNAQIDGQTVTGTFVFNRDVSYELGTENEEVFQSSDTTAVVAAAVLNLLETGELAVGEGLRQELSIDAGAGQHIVEIDYTGVAGAGVQWGNTGNGGTKTDATGEDIHARMCVLDRYLQRATIDSTNPATLEIAEYSSEGKYGPLNVVPRNPNAVFDSVESSSIYDGSITLVETQDIENRSVDQPKA